MYGLEQNFELPTNNDYDGVRYHFSLLISFIVCMFVFAVCEVL